MIAFHHLTPAEQEMAVYHHAKLYVAALNRGAMSFYGEPPEDKFQAVLALAQADAEDCEYSEIERRTILSPRSVENGR